MANSDSKQLHDWNDVIERIPPPHNLSFKGSTAREGPEGQIIVTLPPMANIEAIEQRLGDVIHRATAPVYGDDVQIQYQKVSQAEPEVIEDELPSVPKTSIKPQGFTPVVDSLTHQVGLIPAAIYGVIWRYCQMRENTCYASQKTIAQRLNISRATVNRNLKTLEDQGYIRCLNPDAQFQGTTKEYIVTNKVEFEAAFSITAKEQ